MKPQQTQPATLQQTAPKKWGFGAIVLGVLAFVMPQAIIGSIFYVVLGEEKFESSTSVSFYMYGLAALATLGLLAIILRRYKATFRDLGLGRFKKDFLWQAALGFGAYIALTTVTLAVASALFPGLDIDQEQDLGFGETNTVLALVMIFISLVVVPPVVEELVFRGLIFKGLGRYFPVIAATVVTSALFGLAHGQWNVGLDTFALSLVLCYLVYKTGSLWPAIILHAVKNGLAFTVLFLVKG